jgi:hypothetical protein
MVVKKGKGKLLKREKVEQGKVEQGKVEEGNKNRF